MFRMVDFSQLAYSVQKFLFDFLAAVGVFENGPILPDTAKAQCNYILFVFNNVLVFTSFLLTLEMLFVSILATIIFRPTRTVLFDKHNITRRDFMEIDSQNYCLNNDPYKSSSTFFVGLPKLAEIPNYSKGRLVDNKSFEDSSNSALKYAINKAYINDLDDQG